MSSSMHFDLAYIRLTCSLFGAMQMGLNTCSDGMSKVRRLSWMCSCQKFERLLATFHFDAGLLRALLLSLLLLGSLGWVLRKAASKAVSGRTAGASSGGWETWIGDALCWGKFSLFSARACQ
jgi:hypothetical protein